MNKFSSNARPLLRLSALSVALGMSLTGTALAQSNITGSIFGQVGAKQGDTVLIQNADTGFARSTTVDASGRYRFSSLPVGNYKVTLQKDGAPVSVRDNITVNIASGTDVSFAAAGGGDATNLDSVVVRGGIIPVVEKFSELETICHHAEQLEVRPAIGVRVKLAARGAGRWRSSAGYRSKFGLTVTEAMWKRKPVIGSRVGGTDAEAAGHRAEEGADKEPAPEPHASSRVRRRGTRSPAR